MCGISGIYGALDKESQSKIIERMASLQHHRGPDNMGFFNDDVVALSHNRLSILDLRELAHQPMHSECGRYVLVYNGEVYNFKQLRTKLENLGYEFHTNSDTEVILKLFIFQGPSSFELLNGMFSFCLYDRHQNKIFMVRDRFGIKPLYFYKSQDGLLLFCSELRPIISSLSFTPNVDRSALCDYLWYGTTLDNNTFYSEVQEVRPGSWIEHSEQEHTEHRFARLDKSRERLHIEDADAASQLTCLLRNAVHNQLVSDVPIGVFLSGGVDSTAVVAFASEKIERLRTFSVEFDYAKQSSELEVAARTAKRFGTEHTEICITASNIQKSLINLSSHHGQPFADAANIPLYLMSKEVSQDVKVVLQGDGGDEIFGGYSIYRNFERAKRWKALAYLPYLVRFFGVKHPNILRLSRYISAINEHDLALRNAKLLTVDTVESSPFRIFNSSVRSKLREASSFDYIKSLYNSYPKESTNLDKVFYTDILLQLKDVFLNKVDRSTMASSLEVRVPYLDNELVEFALSLPAEQRVKNYKQKYLLRNALQGVVPDEVLYAKKKGFGVPYGAWLKNDLKDSFLYYLNTETAKKLFDTKYLNKLYALHLDGKGYSSFLLWKVYVLLLQADNDPIFSSSLESLE